MTQPRARLRPPIFPPPEFPGRRPALFSRTPPMIFAPILGMLGLSQAMRRALPKLEMSQAAGELVFGLMVGLWAFAMVAYLAKVARRPATVTEDLAVLPGMAGLACGTMAMMSVAGGLHGIASGLGVALLLPALVLHLAVVALAVIAMRGLPPERRKVSPVFHLLFGGFVVEAIAACRLGHFMLAETVLWVMIPVTVAIWTASLVQLRHSAPPAPLRPLLAIHMAPAGLLANVAFQTGHPLLAEVLLGIALTILLALVASVRWVMAAPFSPLWGLLIYPMAAVIGAMFVVGGMWWVSGAILSVFAFGAAPALAWKVLRLWPGGRLAALTNASTA